MGTVAACGWFGSSGAAYSYWAKMGWCCLLGTEPSIHCGGTWHVACRLWDRGTRDDELLSATGFAGGLEVAGILVLGTEYVRSMEEMSLITYVHIYDVTSGCIVGNKGCDSSEIILGVLCRRRQRPGWLTRGALNVAGAAAVCQQGGTITTSLARSLIPAENHR